MFRAILRPPTARDQIPNWICLHDICSIGRSLTATLDALTPSETMNMLLKEEGDETYES